MEIKNNIFISCSFDPRLKRGIGSFLSLTNEECLKYSPMKKSRLQFITQEFLETTPVCLELETAIWVLDQIDDQLKTDSPIIYTDLKGVGGLLPKRERLEKTDYTGVETGKAVTNANLFEEFYQHHDRLEFSVFYLSEDLEETPETKTVLQLMNAVHSHSCDNLSTQIKTESTEKIAGKWF